MSVAGLFALVASPLWMSLSRHLQLSCPFYLPFCPPSHSQAWPASGLQSKFKLLKGQLLLQPLWPSYFSRELFLSEVLSQEEKSVAPSKGEGVEGRERVAWGDPRTGKAALEPGGLHRGRSTLYPSLGFYINP
ncbi:hypothetical protein ILYODFUR_002643 [Ilyodon furcidens]|uniref:Uncharacterized protein n=1 Tax=Ilyodon furcidens TaxID=33524 RepID=A0ABV0UQR0_9TELE